VERAFSAAQPGSDAVDGGLEERFPPRPIEGGLRARGVRGLAVAPVPFQTQDPDSAASLQSGRFQRLVLNEVADQRFQIGAEARLPGIVAPQGRRFEEPEEERLGGIARVLMGLGPGCPEIMKDRTPVPTRELLQARPPQIRPQVAGPGDQFSIRRREVPAKLPGDRAFHT